MINMRLGPNTWSEILALRQEKIRKHKEMLLKQKREKMQRAKELQETIKLISVSVAVAIGVIVCVVVGFVTIARGSEA